MSRIEKFFLAFITLAVFLALGTRYLTRTPPPPRVDTVLVQRSARAETIAVTTLRTTTRERWRVDSLLRVDTVPLTVRETTFVHTIDTLVKVCEACALELASYRRFADSAIKSRDDSIYRLNVALAKCKGSRPWWATAGVGVGVLACKA